MIIQYLNYLFGADVASTGRSEEKSPGVIEAKDFRRIVPEKYRTDVDALERYIGKSDFKTGLTITVSLQELLEIVPRERRRSDSYLGLRNYLADEMGIELIIKTRKNEQSSL